MTRKEIFIIAIITLITFLAWVAFDIIHKRQSVTIPVNVQEKLEPLNPNFDLGDI